MTYNVFGGTLNPTLLLLNTDQCIATKPCTSPLLYLYVCGRIYVHSAIANWRHCIHTTRLPDAVVDIV